MARADDSPQAQCLELSNELMEHAKLMRDYATTPGDTWLARAELIKIMDLAAQLDALLDKIKASESA